jgi:hypothetical protein
VTEACTPGAEGCPCDQDGSLAKCGKIVSSSGDYVTCSVGYSTCNGTTWGPCVGNTIVIKSLVGRSLVASGLRFQSTTTPCPNVCDPNPSCTSIVGAPTDIHAMGFAVSDSGGVILGASDAGIGTGGNCTGLQCAVVKCAAEAGAADSGSGTTVTGVVTDPAGSNPLVGAMVYVPVDPTGTLPAFTKGVTCDQCGGAAALNAVSVTTTATDGSFTLTNVPSGTNIPIVVQMGKWRREILLKTISPCTVNQVANNCTAADPSMCALRLPRNRFDGYDFTNGTYDRADLPNMAIVTGSADPLECLLLKAGIDPSEVSSYDVNASAKIHFY